MGIPYYYYNIIRKNDGLVLNNIKKCDRLFLDFNSIIHKCSATIIEKHPKNYTWQQMFDEITSYTCKIISICKPNNLVYVAIDGVAPRAKIQQQRRRRYISAYRNNLINDFKRANNMQVSDWDSNCITPGTDFMKALDKYLHSDSFLQCVQPHVQLVISGHEEEGEGEHKIFKYLKGLKGLKGASNVVYGLDADLIMLSMISDQQIYLFRESQEFKRNDTPFKFMNIDALKKVVARQLTSNSIYDYIFICFFVGNDFLPNITFLKIKEGAIDILCDIYRKVYAEKKETIIFNDATTFQVNHSVLVRFLELLSKVEDDGLKSVIENHEKAQYNPNKKFPTMLDKFIYELENYPLIVRFPVSLISPHTDNKWRVHYYHHLFGNFDSALVKQASLNYIEGLIWTSNYYFNQKFDSSWFYGYEYSPCVSDIYKYAFTMEAQRMRELLYNLQTNAYKIDSTLQMLMVLPPQSNTLLPEPCKDITLKLDCNCVHYFPRYFKFATFLKTQLWECSPILPTIDALHLQGCVAKRIVM